MKILIADDERMVRLSLRSMLLDMNICSENIYEAKNGEELVENVKEHTPNIAFVDIRMPKMNDLKAIKLSKSLSPKTNWIILTGFSQFDYAKEAIDLGVAKYLLKPVGPEELEEAITTLKHSIDTELKDNYSKL